jgi:hypothetical protein
MSWAEWEAKAKLMSDAELHGAIADIIASLKNADAMDRCNGGCLGGRYRDESSVYRAELAARLAAKNSAQVCAHCGK